MIVKEVHPLSIVEEQEFRKFMNMTCPGPYGAFTLMCALGAKPPYNDIKKSPLVISEMGIVKEAIRPIHEVERLWYLTTQINVNCPKIDDYWAMQHYFNSIVNTSAALLADIKASLPTRKTISNDLLNQMYLANWEKVQEINGHL